MVKAKSKEDKSTTSIFVNELIKEFGEKIFNHKKEISAISTGSVSLDSSIGIGGIPRGMVTEISGPEGSGKTTIALNIARGLANQEKKTLYIDVENLLNKELLKAVLGEETKVENIITITPDSAEQAFMVAEKGIESKEFDLIVIDSVGAMASKKEKEKEFDEDTMMQVPRLVAKFIRRNAYSIRTKDVAVLVLNQVRDDVKNASKYKTYSTPGGHTLKHQAALRITLTKGSDLTRGEEKVGILTKFVIRKNKLAPPFRSFTLPIIFGQGIDYYADLIDFSKLLGVLQGSGAFYKFEGQTLGQGKAATRETLINSKETLDKIVEKVYNLVNKQSGISELLSDLEDGLESEDETEE